MLNYETLKQYPVFSLMKDYEKSFWALSACSLAISTLGKIMSSFWTKLKSLFTVSVEINSRDDSYEWVIEWINNHPSTRNTKNLAAVTTYIQYDEGDNRPHILLVPNIGNYILKYKGYNLWVNISRDDINTPDTLTRFGGSFGIINITTFGSRKLLQDLVDEAMLISLKKEEGRTIVYTSKNGYWQKFGNSRPVRPLSSVILDQSVKEGLLKDAKEFLNSSEWYYQRGIPYRRGYLLHGPPGTGKTSLVSALAGELGMSVCVVNLNNFDINDEQLVFLFNQTPGKKCILLIEDIDATPSTLCRDSESPTRVSGVSLSGLLNAIDGIAGQEGRILFMTTNHPEKIDEAIVRPGRVDYKAHLGLASKYQLEHLFLNFFPTCEAMAKKFAEFVPEGVYSSAYIQGFFMDFKDSPEKALEQTLIKLQGKN